ncbi:hypothetical protein F3Y22_tig00112632pilonHSYRG00030 [Hibiscus syriacus]|uniref:Uncharacterized protein n=1 Tax=Hibiscus syriacus TaxID=106335 RepID=A0A6A2Y194_HIBSY|nr:hypothetical protein F3Y22_tig00112632pilonHSYRG00030 [Hibiscus syriacus]
MLLCLYLMENASLKQKPTWNLFLVILPPTLYLGYGVFYLKISNATNANKSSSDSENIAGPNSSEADDVSANIQLQILGQDRHLLKYCSHMQNLQYAKVHRTTPPLKHSQETNVGGRRLFSRAAGAIFNQNGIRPGSVWDRLGKPTENDTSVKHVNEFVNMKANVGQNLQWIGQNTWIPSVLNGEVKEICHRTVM